MCSFSFKHLTLEFSASFYLSFLITLFISLFLAVLGLLPLEGFSLVVVSRGYSLTSVLDSHCGGFFLAERRF